MGTVPDRWLWGPPQTAADLGMHDSEPESAVNSDPDTARPIGGVPTAYGRGATDRQRLLLQLLGQAERANWSIHRFKEVLERSAFFDGASTACKVYFDGPNKCWRYGEEVDVRFEIVPRPVCVGTNRLVLCRFEAVESDKEMFLGKDLVVALWPYGNGWVEGMRFKPAGARAHGREDVALKRFGDGGSSHLLDYIRALDESTSDALLTNDAFAAAGRFIFTDFDTPSGKLPRQSRRNVARRPQSWVLGLCDNFEEAGSMYLTQTT